MVLFCTYYTAMFCSIAQQPVICHKECCTPMQAIRMPCFAAFSIVLYSIVLHCTVANSELRDLPEQAQSHSHHAHDAALALRR